MTNDQRTNYWDLIVLTPTGAAPGTYDHVSITIGPDGRILSITAPSTVPDATFVANLANLAALLTNSSAGRLVTVGDGGNAYKALYYYDPNSTSFIEIGNDPSRSVRYVQQSFTTATTTLLGPSLQTNAIIRRVMVQVNSPYPGGTGIAIKGASGTVFMSNDQNDPTTTGVYVADLSSITPLGTPDAQLQVIISGLPNAGNGFVTVEYLLPS